MTTCILLLGHKGWIGQQIVKELKTRHIKFCTTDIRTEDLTPANLLSYSCTHIICCIGRTHGIHEGKQYSTIDYLEMPGRLKENVRDNLFGPIRIIKMAENLNIHVTYFGTGCIFKYDEEHTIFTETDKPNFFGSAYSTMKGFTDQLTQLFSNVLNIRIRMPITTQPHPRDFITKIVNYPRICSIPNSMTILDDCIPIILDLTQRRHCGTINMVNPGVIEHNTILEHYQNLVDPSHTWINMSEEQQDNILASERSNNHLQTSDILLEEYNLRPLAERIPELLQARAKIINSV